MRRPSRADHWCIWLFFCFGAKKSIVFISLHFPAQRTSRSTFSILFFFVRFPLIQFTRARQLTFEFKNSALCVSDDQKHSRRTSKRRGSDGRTLAVLHKIYVLRVFLFFAPVIININNNISREILIFLLCFLIFVRWSVCWSFSSVYTSKTWSPYPFVELVRVQNSFIRSLSKWEVWDCRISQSEQFVR